MTNLSGRARHPTGDVGQGAPGLAPEVRCWYGMRLRFSLLDGSRVAFLWQACWFLGFGAWQLAERVGAWMRAEVGGGERNDYFGSGDVMRGVSIFVIAVVGGVRYVFRDV